MKLDLLLMINTAESKKYIETIDDRISFTEIKYKRVNIVIAKCYISTKNKEDEVKIRFMIG